MPVALTILAGLVLGLGGEEVQLGWRGTDTTTANLPEDLPKAARDAIAAWKDWCVERKYRFDLDEAGKVLFVSRASNDRRDTHMALVQQCVELFDRELPMPARKPGPLAAATPAAPPKPIHTPLPEDPEDETHPWKLAPPTSEERPTHTPAKAMSWSATETAPDTETAVLLLVRNQKDFERMLEHLGKLQPHLAQWARSARSLQGVVLGAPLVGAYLELPDGVEEWDPDHELVNRLARLLLLRRFGELPNWFVQGYAWHMEIALKNAVYCFPWRDDFVSVGDHTDWDRSVAKLYEKDPVSTDFLGWKRGGYCDREAKTSWGVVEYLLDKEPRTPDLLEALHAYREEHSKVQEGTLWHRDTDYEIPAEEQKTLIAEHVGSDFFARATLYMRQGKAGERR